MMLRKLKFGCVAAVSLLGLAFGAAPASAGGCGYYGCGVAEVAWVRPYAYAYASGCGCGASYYYAYAPAYLYRPAYYVDAGYYWRRHRRHHHHHAHW